MQYCSIFYDKVIRSTMYKGSISRLSFTRLIFASIEWSDSQKSNIVETINDSQILTSDKLNKIVEIAHVLQFQFSSTKLLDHLDMRVPK